MKYGGYLLLALYGLSALSLGSLLGPVRCSRGTPLAPFDCGGLHCSGHEGAFADGGSAGLLGASSYPLFLTA